MPKRIQNVAREQLSRTLRVFRPLLQSPPPRKGWLRAIRYALGMSTRQLAQRLGTVPSRITKLEQSEVSGSVTLKNLKRAAEAMDCVFVYAIVPRTSLEDIVEKQAEAVIRDRYRRVAHTMALEEQSVAENRVKAEMKTAIEDLAKRTPKELWNKTR